MSEFICGLTHFSEGNENALLSAPELSLFAIAGGFGGKVRGKQAAEKCLSHIHQFIQNGLEDSEVTLPFVYRSYLSSYSNFIFNAVLYANQQMYVENLPKSKNAAAGASLAVAFIKNGKLVMANVGDCSVYLVRKNQIRELTRTQSYLKHRGRFPFSASFEPAEQGWDFPLMALGIAKDLEPDVTECQLEAGDRIILANESAFYGVKEAELSQWVNELSQSATIEQILKQNQGLESINAMHGNVEKSSIITIAY